MIYLGGILSWLVPNYILERALFREGLAKSIFGFIVSTILAYTILVAIMSYFYPTWESAVGGSVLGGLFTVPLNLLAVFVLTHLWRGALVRSKAEGKVLTPSYGALLQGHLHIYPILLTTLLFAVATKEPVALVIFGIAFLRTIDLQARVLHYVCEISMLESYKGTLLLLVVYGALTAFLTWLTYTFIL